MSITQNQIRTSYTVLATVSNTEPAIYNQQGEPLFNLGDSYYNSTYHLIHTVIQDADEGPMYWGEGETPVDYRLYCDLGTNTFYGCSNGELFARVGSGDITNPLSADLDANNHFIRNLPDAENLGDAVNKKLLDAKANITDVVLSSEKGAANGVATLDGSGKVPSTQLDLPIASTTTAGITKPDGVTLNTSIDGTMSVVGTSFYKPNLLEFKWSDHLFNNISWLRGDTFSWQDGSVYAAVYNELLSEYNNESSTAETDNYDAPYTQPTLSSNGTIGGDTFGVSTDATPYDSRFELWKGFDNTSNTAFHTNAAITSTDNAKYVIWYSPIALNCKSITFTNYYDNYSYASSSGIVYGSNDGTNWDELTTYTNNVSAANTKWDINLSSNNNFYKYYKILCTGTTANSYWAFTQCTLNATQLIAQITYKKTPKEYYIADASQEQSILNLYNTLGIAWYYILDTTNTRFKLPRSMYGFVGIRTRVGKYIEESLPKPTFIVRYDAWGAASEYDKVYGTDGAHFSYSDHDDEHMINYTTPTNNRKAFDIIWPKVYQEGAQVQQRATQMYLYFYVGQFNQSATDQTAGLNSELFNNKLDRDFSNKPSNIQYVVETYDDGNGNGYRVWSNKWCEQYGVRSGTAGWYTITFLKPFRDSNYILTGSVVDINYDYGTQNFGTVDKTSTSVKVCNSYGPGESFYGGQVSWKAEGYIS